MTDAELEQKASDELAAVMETVVQRNLRAEVVQEWLKQAELGGPTPQQQSSYTYLATQIDTLITALEDLDGRVAEEDRPLSDRASSGEGESSTVRLAGNQEEGAESGKSA